MTTGKIHPLLAILLSINTIIGAGLFVNIKVLGVLVGPYGFYSYLCGALIFLPIVFSIAHIASLHPVQSGMYRYSYDYIHPIAGFVSGWAYFLARATSPPLLVYTTVSFIHSLIPWCYTVHPTYISIGIIFALVVLNMSGVSIGGRIQYLFSCIKFTPILLLTFMSFYVCYPFSLPFHMVPYKLDLDSFFQSLPLVAFAYASFEIICSIAHLVQNPHKNMKIIILSSFAFVTVVYILFQGLIGCAVGNFEGIEFPIVYVVDAFCTSATGSYYISYFIQACVYTAILAGAFSGLCSNAWNLHALFYHKWFFGASSMTEINRYGVPWKCLLMEAALSSLILIISHNQIALQNMFVFCIVASFFLTMVACFFYAHTKRLSLLYKTSALLGMGSSIYLLILSLARICASGLSTSFLAIFIIGLLLPMFEFLYKKIY